MLFYSLPTGKFLHAFLSSADFFQNHFLEKKNVQEYHQSIKQFGPDQDLRVFGPDQGPNSLQKLSADDTSRQRVMISLLTLSLLVATFIIC